MLKQPDQVLIIRPTIILLIKTCELLLLLLFHWHYQQQQLKTKDAPAVITHNVLIYLPTIITTCSLLLYLIWL